jgi:SAM-dependent methyltransferase
MRIRDILEHPLAYQYFQEAGGFFGARGKAIERFLPLLENERVADVGCGPGFIVGELPKTLTYVGFDTDQRYIDYATKRFAGPNITFFCESYDQNSAAREGPFDVVMLNGLLHHLPDDEALETIRTIHGSLRPGGRLFTLDGCYVRGQSWIARMMLKYDRGEYVRNRSSYRALVDTVFNKVEVHIDHSLSWFPYTWIVMVARV